MELTVVAQKISNDFLSRNTDLNKSIAKYASENNFNLEKTKRLIEEVNKTCFLQKFASTGEQIFDVAQLELVKNEIKNLDKIEKTAAIKFEDLSYIEKTAEEENLEVSLLAYQGAIQRCRDEKGKELSKLAELKNSIKYDFPDLIKTAEENILELTKNTKFEKIGNEIYRTNLSIEKLDKTINYLLEKEAGIISGLAGTAFKVGSKATGVVVKNPGKSLMGLGVVQSGISGAKKTAPIGEKFVSNIHLEKHAEENNDLEKDASFLGEAGNAAKKMLVNPEMAGAALILGALGLTTAAARKSGGLAARMMHERQLNESFNTISKNNADIRQIPNAREYFDVVARHAPALALDPMVAPQLIRQFDTFGGVDVNTVGKLREIQNTGSNSKNVSSLDLASNFTSGVTKLMPKNQNS